VHVVDRACSVSRAVIAHLVERRATPEIDELVVVIDTDGATRREDIELVHAGYRVRIVAAARAGEVIPVATPAMVVARPDGVLAYVGGYGEEQRPDARSRGDARSDGREDHERFADGAILRELFVFGETRYSVPVVGCSATSARVSTGIMTASSR
jgi:hypothetical protein